LKIKLSPGEAAGLAAIQTTNSKAHDFFLAGREFLTGPTRSRETFDRSVDLLAKAIVEDAGYGEPYAGIAFAHLLNWQNHWTDDWSRSFESAEQNITVALQKSPRIAFVHYVAEVFYFWKKDLDRAAAAGDMALNLNPNYAHAYSTRDLVSMYAGQPLAAVPDVERAIRLDPVSKWHYLHFLGSAYLLAGDYKTAAPVFRERIQLAPKTDLSRAFLAITLGHLGEAEEAQQVWRELMEINPKYSFAEHVERLPFRNRADADRLAEGLSKACIPA
jgi:adenylate cyclase